MIKRTSEAFLAVKSADVNGVEALASSSPFSAIAEGTAKRQGSKGLRVEICKANTTRPLKPCQWNGARKTHRINRIRAK